MRSAQLSHHRGALCPFPAGTRDCEPCVTPAKPRQHRCAPHQLGVQWIVTALGVPRPLMSPRSGGRTLRNFRTGMSGAESPDCSTRVVPGQARPRWSEAGI